MKISRSYLFYKDQLQGEYAKAFDRVELYSKSHEFEEDYVEERLMSLIDMLVEAQAKGEAPQKVVGADVDQFCENYFSDYSMRERVISLVKYIGRLAWGIVLIGGFIIAMERPGFWQELIRLKSDMGAFVVGMVAGGLASFLIDTLMKHFFRSKIHVTDKMRSWCMIGLMTLFIVLGLWCFPENMLIFSVFPMTMAAVLYIVSYYVIRAIWRYRDHGDLKSLSDHVEGEKKGQAFLDNVRRQMPEQILKQYNKKNERRRRMGRPEQTREEYMRKWMKETKFLKYEPYVLWPILILIFLIYAARAEMDFGAIEAVVVMGFILLFEVPILFFIWSMQKGCAIRREMGQNCEDRGIDIITYCIEQEEAAQTLIDGGLN